MSATELTVAGQGIVVTGAAGGIGKALATRLVAEGARVAVNDLDPAATEATLVAVGAYPVPGDTASEAGAATLVAADREHLGEIRSPGRGSSW